jgi:hypothetical protein
MIDDMTYSVQHLIIFTGITAVDCSHGIDSMRPERSRKHIL